MSTTHSPRFSAGFAAILMLLSTACNSKTVVQDRPVVVNRPVAVPCALERPQTPALLPADWESLDVKQKAALVGFKLIEWRDYGEALNAATSGCE